MLHHNDCPVCGNGNIRLLHEAADHLVTGNKFAVWHCSNCDFAFTQDAPDEKDAGVFYESADYISHTDTSRSLFEKIYQAVRRFMLRRKRQLVENRSGFRTGRLLDIGSGTGHFLNTMKEAGWKVSGIEINSGAREYSVSKFGLEVTTPGGINAFPTGGFDCVTLWHVAEHIYDLDDTFSEIKRILSAEGCVVVALPNSGSADADLYRGNWAAWDVPRHLWHFSENSFRLFAENSGFTVSAVSILPFDVFYISVLSEKNSGSKMPMFKGMLRGLCFSFRTLFKREKGSSLVYVLKKKSDQ
jgi:SAM-dependent methyltransferase